MHDRNSTFLLVRKAQAGDDVALGTLLQRYEGRLRRIVRVRLGPRLRARLDSADILQDVFVKAVRIFDRFEMRHEASLIRWLGRIAERTIRGEADRHGAQRRSADAEAGPWPEACGGRTPADDSLRPDLLAERTEGERRLEHALDRLSEPERELVLARDFEGLDWAAVAEATGRPSPDAARMAYAAARSRLARLVRGQHRGR